MKLHRRIRRGTALALLFLVLINGVGFSQSEPPVELQAETEAELQSVPPGWKIETVDDGRLINELGPHSLAYGPDGYPHIAYGEDSLYHAWWNGTSWMVETVDNTPLVGKQASISVDSQGFVYISYYDEGNQDLKYATNWFSGWQVTTLADIGDVGSQSYIFAFWGDQGPNIYVGYLDATNHKVMFRYSEEEMYGGWSAPEIASGSLYASKFAMTMRGYQAYMSIARFNSTTSHFEVWYSYQNLGVWQTPELVDNGQASTNMGIAVASDGTPYIPVSIYEPEFSGWVTYLAYKSGALWSGADYPNLILSLYDPKPDAVSVSYSPWENKVYVAMQLPGSSSNFHNLVIARGLNDIWDVGTIFTVQSNVYGDVFPAVAVSLFDDSPKAGVVYLSSGFLKYEFLPGPPAVEVWSEGMVNVTSSQDMGDCNVLRVDSSGTVHLLYYNSGNGALYYRHTSSNGWTSRQPVTGPNEWAQCGPFSRPGMDLLANNTPVVSYVNSSGELKYAYWYCIGRSCFARSTVDTGLITGATAIAIRTGDRPYIIYHKNDKLTLAYDNTPMVLDWQKLSINDSLSTFGPVALETDKDNRLHAAFVTNMDTPYYARFGFGSETWSNITRLEPADWTMDPIQIAINPVSNYPQVAFIVGNLTGHPLVVREYSVAQDWNSRPTIDSTSGQLRAPSFVVDSAGRQLFAYYYKNQTQGVDGLKLMIRSGSTVNPLMIDSSIGLIDSTSIALRPGNVPVIAYHVPALGQINVAWGPVSVFLPLIRR